MPKVSRRLALVLPTAVASIAMTLATWAASHERSPV
jgi:hypothetical protein